ncbi:hypothetical protein JHK86_012603 [Glycine max]|nr:hypothetical protein JHK86_012603 [Glycine max]
MEIYKLPSLLNAVKVMIYECDLIKWTGVLGGRKDVVSRVEGDFSCTFEVSSAIPVLKNAYGGSMKNVLHVGPESCSVVAKFLREGETEAWGVEPYDIEDADRNCKALVQKGIVRVADIKFPLPYRAKSFSHVIVSDALDYLSPKYLNKSLPELARVSADGYPGQRRAKIAQLSKFGRPVDPRYGKFILEGVRRSIVASSQ